MSPLCPLCTLVPATVEQRVGECARWNAVRATFSLPQMEVVKEWPSCTRQCGIFVDDVRVLALAEEFYDEERALEEYIAHFDMISCLNRRPTNDLVTPQALWTDGAASHNQETASEELGAAYSTHVAIL